MPEMKRNTLNFLVDLVSALIMLGIVATGLIMRFVLPPGSGAARRLWALNRHEWGDVHFWLAVAAAAAAAVLLVHLVLHWQWVTVMISRMLLRRSPTEVPSRLCRNVAGAALLSLVIGALTAFVFVARNSTVTAPRGQDGGPAGRAFRGGAAPSGEHLYGSMTLAEAAIACGMTVDELRERLQLPASVPADHRLAWLWRDYGLSLQQIRQIVLQDQLPSQ